MRNLRKAFRNAFRPTIRNPEIRDHEAVKDEVARGVVRRTATGNVRLQQGRYLTKEESADKFKKAGGHGFDEQRRR